MKHTLRHMIIFWMGMIRILNYIMSSRTNREICIFVPDCMVPKSNQQRNAKKAVNGSLESKVWYGTIPDAG